MADDTPLSAVLAEIRARHDAATPGPWKIAAERHVDMDNEPFQVTWVEGPDGKFLLGAHVDGRASDTRFAAHARTDVPRLLAALDAVLKGHDPVQVYESADVCGHERPRELDAEDRACWPEEAASIQFVIEAWDEDHPAGVPLTPDGDDPGRICLARPQEIICPACSQARYGESWETEGAYVLAGDCIVRPVITRELTGEETPDA